MELGDTRFESEGVQNRHIPMSLPFHSIPSLLPKLKLIRHKHRHSPYLLTPTVPLYSSVQKERHELMKLA
jgi:hypothetical protein